MITTFLQSLSISVKTLLPIALLSLSTADDTKVWNYASQNNLTIVTKDADFNDLTLLHGIPPKVIWLRLGNCTTELISTTLHTRWNEIKKFLEDPHHELMIITHPDKNISSNLDIEETKEKES